MKKRTLKVIDKTIMSVCEKIIKNEKYCCEDEYYKTVAVLMVFLKLNGNSDKEKERHVVIEKQEKIDGTIFTVRDE